MQTITLVFAGAAALVAAQSVPPPAPVLLTTTKSAVLPVLPTPFNGVETLQGAIIMKAPANASYVPVNGPAQVQSNLPAATYVAVLPPRAFNELTGTIIQGNITGSAQEGATGVTWTINLSNLPDTAQYGTFVYHIHNDRVPEDGNCTSTMAHFDPTNAGEYYMCSTANPQNCQAGDLAGKHGRVSGPTFTTTYVDNYLSTDPSSEFFFGAKSIVIHTANTTRLTCANFVLASGSGTNGTQSPTGTSVPQPTFTGAASKTLIGGAFVGLLAAALSFVL